MKKILLVTRNFPPLNGGMENLNYHIYQELSQTFEMLIVGPMGSQEYLKPNTLCSQFPQKPLHFFLWFSFWKTLKMCVKEKPDLIISGSGATGLTSRIIGYLCKIQVVTYLHGLDLVVPNMLYQILFLPAIRKCDALWVNSQNTARLAINKGIDPKKITVLYPGVALPQPVSKSFNPDQFKTVLGLDTNSIILLSVGRLTNRKGLVEFIQYSLTNIINTEPRVVFVIIGDEPNNALHHKLGEKQKILQSIQDHNLADHVVLLGHVSESQLKQAYLSSHLHVFPGLDLPGDVEGFGMVAIEAAAHGLPTVAFAVGGIPESVNHNTSGWLIKSGDYAAMTQTILNSISDTDSLHKKVTADTCLHHAQDFSWIIFGQKIKYLCNEILTKQGFSS